MNPTEHESAGGLRRCGWLPVVGGALAVAWYLLMAGAWYVLGSSGYQAWFFRVQHDWISGFSFLAFGVAMGILLARRRALRAEARGLEMGLLGADEEALILPDDALALRKRLTQLAPAERGLIVVRLLSAGLQRARANWSATDVGEAIKTEAELVQGETASTYATVRYLAWAIPSLGFIGTVLGVGAAIGALRGVEDTAADPMEMAAANLHTAFDTTLVALALSLVLMYMLYRGEANEDRFVVRAVEWCMRRLVFRMYMPKESRG